MCWRLPAVRLTGREKGRRKSCHGCMGQLGRPPGNKSADNTGGSRAGASSARARAKNRMKEAASSLHRPPTSTASTTNRHLCARTSSG